MEKQDINISIDDLSSITNEVFNGLSKNGTNIAITTDYYWEIPMDLKYKLKAPDKNNITMGSLTDDWQEVKEIQSQKDDVLLWRKCELLSRIWMAIGNELLMPGVGNEW